MVAATVEAVVVDNVDPAPTWRILSVKSNEAASGLGAGDLAPDWQVTGGHTLNLRAERSPVSLGRVYTITLEARDASGNTSTRIVRVTVPRTR